MFWRLLDLFKALYTAAFVITDKTKIKMTDYAVQYLSYQISHQFYESLMTYTYMQKSIQVVFKVRTVMGQIG
jgi:hypothetical protein